MFTTIANEEQHLEFNARGHDFNLNGHPLLPFEKAQQAQSTAITVRQTRLDTKEQSLNVNLNFAMEVMPAIPSIPLPHKDQVSLIPIEFTVLGLNGVPVKVNTISFKLIETPDKDLVLVRSEEIPFQETPGAETCEGARPWSLCRLKAIIMARVKAMMEAAKEKTDKVQGWIKEKAHHCKGKRPHKSAHKDGDHPHPPHWRGHKHHNKHHRYHRLGHMLHQTFRFFIIPALLGVIGGLTASAIGMLVGQAIVLIWFKTYRQGRRGPLHLVQQEMVVEVEEKDELLGQEDDMPPQYEDAPRYEEAVELRDEKN